MADKNINSQIQEEPLVTEVREPISIPNNASSSTARPIISPSKSRGNKTGTRSTFCPNSQIRLTGKLTDDDDHPVPQKGFLGILGFRASEPTSNPNDIKGNESASAFVPYY